MYNFIFWVLYSMNLSDGQFSAKFQAIIVVAFAFFIHIMLIVSVIKKYFFSLYTSLPVPFFGNKLLILLFIVIALILFFRYYTEKRIDNIVYRYSAKPTYMVFNKIKVGMIVIAPLIFMVIILSNLHK